MKTFRSKLNNAFCILEILFLFHYYHRIIVGVNSFHLFGRAIVRSKSCVETRTPLMLSGETNSNEKDDARMMDIHGPAIDAIAHGLYIRGAEMKDMPLKFVDDGEMEAWQVTYTAGKISQGAILGWKRSRQVLSASIDEEEEEMLEQTLGGRIFAVLSRLEELEECLEQTARNSNNEKASNDETIWNSLGVSSIHNADELLRTDEDFRKNRARSLLALFLHTMEGPGMRRNNVVVPCMDIDFLTPTEEQLLLMPFDTTTTSTPEEDTVMVQDTQEEAEEAEEERPSLHPITIQAIAEAFQLRAQNKTTSPLRLITDETEWYEVQYSAVKFAERFLESNNKNDQFTEEEAQTIAGRIVGVSMRLEDLEWEWNHRIETSSFATTTTTTESNAEEQHWKHRFGLLANEKDIQLLDETLLNDEVFAKTRSERMLGIFLLNLEGPAIRRSGNKVPGGSHVDFIDDASQLELMMPRDPKK